MSSPFIRGLNYPLGFARIAGRGEWGEQCAAGENSTNTTGSRERARRVLVVDENPDAARSLAALIEALGLEVEVCYDGASALETARRRQPDIIFLDLVMPGVDGFELARQLRADSAFAHTLIVAVTGLSSEEDRRRSQEAGIDHYLVKPADPAFISSLVRARRW